MSYRKKHIKNKLNKIKPRHSIFTRLWFWIGVLVLIIICAGLYFLLFYPGFQVKNILISGNEKIKTQDLQNLVLQNSHTGLVKLWNFELMSGSIFLLNTNKIDKEILQKFPAVEKAIMNKNLPQTLKLGIIERKPVGIFCNNNNCFLIDSNGVIFEGINASAPDFFIVRQTLEDQNLYTGESVVAQKIIGVITKIQKDLKDNFQINVKEALISTPIRLNITTNDGWQVYFSLEGDASVDQQITELNALLNGDINSDARKTLQYIDLRFKDRAYYK